MHARHAHTHAHTHTRTRTHARARARTHTHTQGVVFLLDDCDDFGIPLRSCARCAVFYDIIYITNIISYHIILCMIYNISRRDELGNPLRSRAL